MKTPLTEQLLSAWDPSKACASPLTLPLVIATCKAKNRRLGMIMNLAGHDCLYEDDIPADVAMHHVRHPSPISMTCIVDGVYACVYACGYACGSPMQINSRALLVD
jgi:hypothetical protein